jgi:hypothetical protein
LTDRPRAANVGGMSERPRPVRRVAAGWVAVLVTLAAVGLVLTASRSGRTSTISPVTTRSAPAPATVTLTPAQAQDPATPDGSQSAPPLVIDAFLGLVLVALLAMAGYAVTTWVRQGGSGGLVRRRVPAPRRPPPPPDADRRAAEALTEAVDLGLRRLDEGEPRDAVIACWVVLERAAAEAGTPRRPSETPAQLVTRVLAQHLVSREALERLVGLYREARYSAHVLGPSARGEARTALERVRTELAGEASLP